MPLRLALLLACATLTALAQPRPNVIVIFADDMGFGDVAANGSPDIETPHLDRMAAEGARLTSFYAQMFCGPSRAALMTGNYPPRVGLMFNHSPRNTTGINPDTYTMAEMFRDAGYATYMVGKWHLGDRPEFLPHRHGFEHWFGIPFSNDMWRYHPKMPPEPNEDARMSAARHRARLTGFGGEGSWYGPNGGFPHPLPLMADDEILELDSDQTKLTTLYTQKSLAFIEENKDNPFFLYLPHAMPHVPLFVSDKFLGKSERGLYGDVIAEIDWSTGQILGKLRELGIDDNTIVVFTSDNGPWQQYGVDGGSAGPYRLGKGTIWEGGLRVPGIFRWPGHIPAGLVTDELAANLDLLPTFAKLIDAKLPANHYADGHDILPLLTKPGTQTPHEAFYYFGGSRPPDEPRLLAIRRGPWKAHFRPKTFEPIHLYNLAEDPGESVDRLSEHRRLADQLAQKAKAFRANLDQHAIPLAHAN